MTREQIEAEIQTRQAAVDENRARLRELYAMREGVVIVDTRKQSIEDAIAAVETRYAETAKEEAVIEEAQDAEAVKE
jgi:hypothetical protein